MEMVLMCSSGPAQRFFARVILRLLRAKHATLVLGLDYCIICLMTTDVDTPCSARKPRARESERSESGNLIPREERKGERQAQGVGQNTDRVAERVASHSSRNQKENSPSARPLDAERLTGSAGSSKGVEQEEEGWKVREKRVARESQTKVPQRKLPRTEVFLGFLYRGQRL